MTTREPPCQRCECRAELDAHGDPTRLALAIDAIEQGECDCAHGDPACVGCASRAALAQVLRERDEARSIAAVLSHAYDHDTRPPESMLDRARDWRRK